MYLDKAFVNESQETIDNIYRCYYWMGYGGISEEDTLFIKNSDVDLSKMLIHYKDTSVPVYAATKTMTIRSTLSHRSADAIKTGKTEQQLSFHRIWLSGLFYRVYERERAGVPANFSDAAVSFMEGRTYLLNGREKIEHKKNRIERDYMEDYQRWKLAFSI